MLTHSQSIGLLLLAISALILCARDIWRWLPVGTKSVLFGAHCFFLHPFFLALAWTRLYGFPWDPRLWVCFFVHDLGYIGKPNMDGQEGEEHPLLGARIMHWFDWRRVVRDGYGERVGDVRGTKWRDLALCHSRYFAKRLNKPFSRVCVADKLAFVLTPRWLYLPMVRFTGEVYEYLNRARTADIAAGHFKAGDYTHDITGWHEELCRYMLSWIDAHKYGQRDDWTNADRHAQEAAIKQAAMQQERTSFGLNWKGHESAISYAGAAGRSDAACGGAIGSGSLLKPASTVCPVVGCYCPPGECFAPKIMGTQMPCRRAS